jgi:predicted ester cyclase
VIDLEHNKRLIRNFIDTVWVRGEIGRLDEFWTQDCINHAAPQGADTGLPALKTYHEQFGMAFAAFSDVRIDVEQQIAELDRVVTQIRTTGRLASGKQVHLTTIRIDRISGGKIAEHWSVADMAGLMEQSK